VHLAHPLGIKAFTYRRVKNDQKDAGDLADLLRMGRLAEAWIAPAEVRELRELTRYRIKLVRMRSSGKEQVHAVLAKLGIPVTCSDLGDWPPYHAVRALPGLGPVTVAEIGDISRFPGPGHLCSWAGLTPRHRESDLKVTRGHITKQGSPLLRWAMVEAIQHQPDDSPPRELKDRIIARRGAQARNIAKAAAARKLLTCVFYAMRDGQVRSLAARSRAQEAG
jgi:transposase